MPFVQAYKESIENETDKRIKELQEDHEKKINRLKKDINDIVARWAARKDKLIERGKIKCEIQFERDRQTLTQAKDAFLRENYKKAILLMNGINLSAFTSQKFLLDTFDSDFFTRIAHPFVKFLFKSDILKNDNMHEKLLEKDWFQFLARIAVVMNEFSQYDTLENRNFTSVRIRLECLEKLVSTSHSLSLMETMARVNETDFSLELSYPNIIAQTVVLHGIKYANKQLISKVFTDDRFRWKEFYSERCSVKEENAGGSYFLSTKDYNIRSIPVALNITRPTRLVYKDENGSIQFSVTPNVESNDIHLTSLVVMESDRYGMLLATGDRGANTTYSGVRIYSIKCSKEEYQQAILDLQLQLKQADSISEKAYSDFLKRMKLKDIDGVIVMEQLKGYCGFQSSAELTEFSTSLFSAMHHGYSKQGVKLNLYNALQTACYVATHYNNQQMRDYRIEVLNDLLGFLDRNPILNIQDNVFRDIHFMALKYGLPEELTYRFPGTLAQTFPAVYKEYLRQERYPRREFNKRDLEKVELATYKLFLLFKHCKQDYDEDRLIEMRQLDDKIALCHKEGFSKALLYYQNTKLVEIELSRKNPFQKLAISYHKQDKTFKQ